jgi:hypothetical protein
MRKRPNLAEVWHLANGIIGELEAWLAHGGKSMRLTISPINQARLLRLRVWSIRYCLSIAEILDLIMPILRAQARRPKHTYSLGISVPALTGDAAERILKAEIPKRYREGEHIQIARIREQEVQLRREHADELDGLASKEYFTRSLMDVATVEQFVNMYREHVISRRNTYQNEMGAKWRSRKAYRYSPWRAA